MRAWRFGMLIAALSGSFGAVASAQGIGGVSGGLNSDGGAISGATINRVNGINANGTPRQQDPGVSITNGAGNSTMTPGVTGAPNGVTGLGTPQTVPPTVILHNNASGGGSP